LLHCCQCFLGPFGNPKPLTAPSILKWHFASVGDDRGVNEARGYACEIVAWRTLHHLSEQELIDCLLLELPAAEQSAERPCDTEANMTNELGQRRPSLNDLVNENASLLREQCEAPRKHARLQQSGLQYKPHTRPSGDGMLTAFEEDPTLSFAGLNALEIAAVADAKKFLSQPVVQKIVNGIWSGEIVFWESLSVHTRKKPQVYSKR